MLCLLKYCCLVCVDMIIRCNVLHGHLTDNKSCYSILFCDETNKTVSFLNKT
jgi:hypothetical protein